jgi:hypothetical protein
MAELGFGLRFQVLGVPLVGLVGKDGYINLLVWI